MTARHSKLMVLPLLVTLLGLGACGGGGGGQSAASAKQEITTTWVAFFGGKGSIDQLQDGSTLQQAYQANLNSPLAKSTTAKVNAVSVLAANACGTNGVPSPCAEVTYDLQAGGQTVLPGAKGYATKQNGKWKVSKTTFCSLLQLAGGSQAPPGC